jgi:CheY-like chemotaxis protein
MFTVRMPVRAVRAGKAEITARKNQPDTAQRIPNVESEILKGVRVLLVEDNAEDRDVMVAELALLGATVCSSSSVNEALIKLDEFQPDVLVADIAMPDEDGYSLIRRIRARPQDQRSLTPAIALTAFAGDANRKRALEAGFHRHVAKPADPAELARTIVGLARHNAA